MPISTPKPGALLDLKVSALHGVTVAVAYSGGPDATALAARLKADGATVLPVYVAYRGPGGKTAKDLRFAKRSAELLQLPSRWIDEPLVRRIDSDSKSQRNRIIVAAISMALGQQVQCVGIGTFKQTFEAAGQWTDDSNEDIDPAILSRPLTPQGHRLITWDSYGVSGKAEQFRNLSAQDRAALFATTSCQLWWKVECGNCYSCLERNEAFLAAFGVDPTGYRAKSTVTRRALAVAQA